MVTNRDRKLFVIALKKFENLLRRMAPLTFLIRVRAFRDPLGGELPHVQIFVHDWPNSLRWDDQLFSYWLSGNPAVFEDLLVNLINNLRGGQFFGSSRTRRITGGKITTFKIGPHSFWRWHTMMHVPLMFLSELREFPSAPYLAEKKNWWQLTAACLWNRARRLTCFLSACVTRKYCNPAHEPTPLSNDTIDSVLRHRVVGRAKDLSAHPHKHTLTLL